MILSFRYRLLPQKCQHLALQEILESQRQLYNAALQERIEAYQKAGVSRTFIDQCRSLTEWRQGDSGATGLPVALQRWTLKRVDEAYKGFFRRLAARKKPGFPRFRGAGRFSAFGFRQFHGVSFDNGRIRFKGMPGALRVHVHRPLPSGARIRSCVFRQDVKGWHVSLAVDVPTAVRHAGKGVVGVDLGVSTFAVLSDGGFIPSLRAARKAEGRLRVAQRALARKVRGSGGRQKTRTLLARCEAATERLRTNHLHQASARLVRDYQVIVVEKLSVSGLSKSALAKDVHDASWARFLSMLRYKAECAGSRLIEVDAHNTSQECSGCGKIVAKELRDRIHVCHHCGLSIDRDLNAARTILNRAGAGPGPA